MKMKMPTDGIGRIESAFLAARGRTAVIPFILGSRDNAQDVVEHFLVMQEEGADMIEFAASCSSPWEDGLTIHDSLNIVKDARSNGLAIPVILTAYHVSFEKEYGFDSDRMCRVIAASGVDGCLAIGISRGKQEIRFNEHCHKYGMSNIPLVRPGNSDGRILDLVDMASTFLYVAFDKTMLENTDGIIDRVRMASDLPLITRFGVSIPDTADGFHNLTDGIVVSNIDNTNASFDISSLKRGTKCKNSATKYSKVPGHIKDKDIAMFSWVLDPKHALIQVCEALSQSHI